MFGECRDIYNPWSILNFLDKRKYTTYWANTSANSLVGKLIREGSKRVKTSFETLLRGDVLICPIDEQIVYNQLNGNEAAIWSLLLASGYLKVLSKEEYDELKGGVCQPFTVGKNAFLTNSRQPVITANSKLVLVFNVVV